MTEAHLQHTVYLSMKKLIQNMNIKQSKKIVNSKIKRIVKKLRHWSIN